MNGTRLLKPVLSRQILDHQQIGTRRIVATDHPIYDELVRDQRGSRRARWEIVRGLCNGVPSSVAVYKTETEARNAWKALVSTAQLAEGTVST